MRAEGLKKVKGELAFSTAQLAEQHTLNQQHPIEDHVPNPTFEFLISCFFYFAISVSAPFSGAHINPAVTLSLNLIETSNKKIIYIVSQLVGGLAGASIGKDVSTQPTASSE